MLAPFILVLEASRYDEAEPIYKRSLAILEKVLGPQHPDTRAVLQLYRAQGRDKEAERLLRD
jgi:hypothetical protein